eukprot:CAMPEP_0115880548 /NCGR_PEP_ID=MMETSP0287-20121206/27939_1 /TAXON_ID=412157 /ORGANISM="Chrysochromulina rotalis, Strain UIO044" /LENGTH=938 /DNA_ID=CAMNT_0003336385 /DNA_START=211 /DNA_END=3023 /DNA_ORIENTATION=+
MYLQIMAALLFSKQKINQVQAGSVLLVSRYNLQEGDREPVGQDLILESPRLWMLLSHRKPLIIILFDDEYCQMPWLNTAHHVLYRTTWNAGWHNEWLSSLLSEDNTEPIRWPWLRSFPFGTSYDDGHLSELSAERRPANKRRVLFNFRGSTTYRKPYRTQLRSYITQNVQDLKAVANRLMAHVPLHPSGVGRYVLDVYERDSSSQTRTKITYLELLRDSIFTLSPPGDVWESYRTMEAIEAGSIPIVFVVAEYKWCTEPASHSIATMNGIIPLQNWSELIPVLVRELRNHSALISKQQGMLSWLAQHKTVIRVQLAETSRRMLASREGVRASLWRPATACKTTPIAPHELAQQQVAISSHWRKAQAFTDSPWELGWVDHPTDARSFIDRGGFCSSTSDDFREICLSPACAPPLIADFSCGDITKREYGTEKRSRSRNPISRSNFKLAGKTVYMVYVDRYALSSGNMNQPQCFGDLWCGGTLRGLTNHIDYIELMGFDCLWITPVVEQFDGTNCFSSWCGTAYHGYWARNFYNIDSHFGTREDLLALSEALRSRGMCFILDIVVNHVRPIHSEKDLKSVYPFDEIEYFHTYNRLENESFTVYASHPASCLAYVAAGCSLGQDACEGYDETLIMDGWFYDLADLNQSHPFVHAQLLVWVRHVVDTYQVDALRLDTAPYMPMSFLADVRAAARVEILAEVTTTDDAFLGRFQGAGLDAVTNFPLSYLIPQAFCTGLVPQHGDSSGFAIQGATREPTRSLMRQLAVTVNRQVAGKYLSDVDRLANFVDTGDMDRIARVCALNIFRVANALTFVMMIRGIPIVYYGTEQNFNQQHNRASLWHRSFKSSTEMYRLLADLNSVRNEFDLRLSTMTVVHVDNASIIFRRGVNPRRSIWVFLNNDAGGANTTRLYCAANVTLLPSAPHYFWRDYLSGRAASFKDGCV